MKRGNEGKKRNIVNNIRNLDDMRRQRVGFTYLYF